MDANGCRMHSTGMAPVEEAHLEGLWEDLGASGESTARAPQGPCGDSPSCSDSPIWSTLSRVTCASWPAPATC